MAKNHHFSLFEILNLVPEAQKYFFDIFNKKTTCLYIGLTKIALPTVAIKTYRIPKCILKDRIVKVWIAHCTFLSGISQRNKTMSKKKYQNQMWPFFPKNHLNALLFISTHSRTFKVYFQKFINVTEISKYLQNDGASVQPR